MRYNKWKVFLALEWLKNLAFSLQSIIYFMVTSPKLLSWIKNESLLKSLQPFAKWHYIERDLATFNINIDDDYVPCLQGVTRASYCNVYLEWIQYCARKRQEVGRGWTREHQVQKQRNV